MDMRMEQQCGPYRLVRLLGQGGFADVYLAEHHLLKTYAAVKVLRERLVTAQDAQGFMHEAQVIAKLRHPHILRVLDFGFVQQKPYLVTEFAPGGSLREVHPNGTRIDVANVIRYVQQIASALAYAHQRKLIHRDVKPENLLVDENGEIVLADFGIATVAHSTESMQTVDKSGTVAYMAPEQIKGMPRPASDQYALALVVYEWLSGVRAFSGSSAIEIAMRQLSEEPPPLRQWVPSLPRELEACIAKALSKDYQQRFSDIQIFADALVQSIASGHNADAPVPAFLPDPSSRRFWNYEPRKRPKRVW